MFFLLYKHTDGIFVDFLKISEDFPKLFRRPERFKYNLRDKLDISEIIDIFT